MPLAARVVECPNELESIRDDWDQLAVLLERPFSAPAWSMAWWQHLRPGGARLQTILVEDRQGLAGVLPLFSRGRSLAAVGGEVAPVEPLARPGQEDKVAAAAAAVLAKLRPPRRIGLQLHGTSPEWGEFLSSGWPDRRGLWRWVELEAPVPRIDLGEEGFEAWLGAKSGSFRRDVRRNRRALEERGGIFRLATAESLESDVGEFLRLHRTRLAGKGGTRLVNDRVREMLIAVGSGLLPGNRFRLLCLEVDGKVVACQLLLAAGREVSAWNSGFDEAYGQLSPSIQCIVHALEDASARGERTMSLGPGGQPYKYRLSTDEDCLRSQVLIPHGGAYPLLRLRMVPRQMRRELGRRLPADAKMRLRKMIRPDSLPQ